MSYFIDRTHHLAVDRVMYNLLNEAAIDLEEVNWKVLEITERGQTSTKVIKSELTTLCFEVVNKAVSLRIAANSRFLRDLKANFLCIDIAVFQLLDDKL